LVKLVEGFVPIRGFGQVEASQSWGKRRKREGPQPLPGFSRDRMARGIPSPPRRRRAQAMIPLHIDQCVPTEHRPESFNLTLENSKQHLSTKQTEKSQFFKLRYAFF